MYYNITYTFKSGKVVKVPFFHLVNLLRWYRLMKDSLQSVVVEIYVNNVLHEKFVWNE